VPTATPTPTLTPSPTPQPEILIFKTADPQSVPLGGQVTFTISVRNSGPVDLIAIEVADVVPDGLTYVPNSASDGGNYAAATRSVEWSLPTLGVGASQQLSYTATLDDASKPVTNTACVAAQTATAAQVTDCSDVPVNPLPTPTPNPPAPSVPTSTPVSTPNRSPTVPGAPTSVGTSTPTATSTATPTLTPTVTPTPTPTLEAQVVEARQVVLGIVIKRLQQRLLQDAPEQVLPGPLPSERVPPVQLPPVGAQGPY
jgi:uncharacterized repeat protein (TIGR01451 family)